MATSRPRGKGVTSIALSAIRLDELLDVYHERVSICVWREKRSSCFFSRQKTTKCALGGGGGPRGIFFFRLVYFWCSPSRFASVIFPTTVRTNSNTPVYFGMTACALATSARTICHRIPPIDGVAFTSTLVNQRPLPPRTIEFIHQPHSSSHH